MSLQGTPGNADANLVQFRIERGATAMGTDGALGSVEQIVVDRDTGELRALIVHSASGNGEFELPATHVTRATGSHVYLDIGQADLASRPDLATPYDPQQYVPVYQGNASPVGQATRTAISTEHPVVTGVEENAAELVAPDTTAGRGPDEIATAPLTPPPDIPSTEQPAIDTATTMPLSADALRQSSAASMTPAGTPTDTRVDTSAPIGQPAVQTGPAVGDGADVAPNRGESTMPSTTGSLMGGLPSTSGMGEKASVPNSDSEPNNMRLDEEYTGERASSESGLLEAFREGGSEPWSVPTDERTETETDELAASEANDELSEIDGLGAVRPEVASASAASNAATALEGPTLASDVTAPPPAPATPDPATPPSGATPSAPTPPPLTGLTGTVTAERQLPEPTVGSRLSAQIPPLSQVPELVPAVPNTALFAASGIGAVVGLGILLRQRQSRSRSVARTARRTARNAQGAAAQLTAEAGANAKRAVRRVRWFRRGLLLGGMLAILFAPKPGEALRNQIGASLDNWRSGSR